MTGRRPHWDDDLIEAVTCLVSVDIGDDCLPAVDVYEVIAAVEDWQDARGDAIDGRSLTEAIFAVQRVRERAEGPTPAVHGDWMAGYASAMRDVLHAMDGGV